MKGLLHLNALHLQMVRLVTAGFFAIVVSGSGRAFADDGSTARAEHQETSFWTPRTRITASLVVGSLVLAGVGVGFTVANRSAINHVNDLHNQITGDSACSNPTPQLAGPCADLRNSLNNENTYAFASMGAFVAAGTLVTAAIVSYVLWPHSPEKRLAFVPYVSVPSRSAGFQYSF